MRPIQGWTLVCAFACLIGIVLFTSVKRSQETALRCGAIQGFLQKEAKDCLAGCARVGVTQACVDTCADNMTGAYGALCGKE